ncbi:MAG: hypothetical protein K8H89_12470 [Flavobacteriales bacterium]|nr:hypothetical protein [Flavobacteriales bacterium]MCB0758783.1 hypothetical protein [Flavobacteriales bacterium]
MTLRNTTIWAAAIMLGLTVVSCGGGDKADRAETTADTLATAPTGDGLVKVGGKLFSIPSPVQTAMLIREVGMPYANELPLSTDSTSRFATKQKQALAMGVYGADLAYVAIHKDGQRSLRTLKAIEQLSGQLNLSNAFDKQLLDAFKKNINNEDSLLRLTGKAFRAADMYLKNDQRNDVSTGVLAGGWIEGLYLTLGSTGETVNPKITARLAEQRHTLNNLIALLEANDGSSELVAALKDLATDYQSVTSEYKFVKPTLDVVNKTTYINSVTKAEVSPEALQTIIRKVRAIRSSIIA